MSKGFIGTVVVNSSADEAVYGPIFDYLNSVKASTVWTRHAIQVDLAAKLNSLGLGITAGDIDKSSITNTPEYLGLEVIDKEGKVSNYVLPYTVEGDDLKIVCYENVDYVKLVDGVKIDSPLTEDGRAIKMAGDINVSGSVQVQPVKIDGPVQVSLKPTAQPETEDQALWVVIRNSSKAMSFGNYKDFIDNVMCCRQPLNPPNQDSKKRFESRLPFPGVNDYNLLKVATEVFLMDKCGVKVDFESLDLSEEKLRLGRDMTPERIEYLWRKYRERVEASLLFSITGKDTVDTIVKALDEGDLAKIMVIFQDAGRPLTNAKIAQVVSGRRWYVIDTYDGDGKKYEEEYDIRKEEEEKLSGYYTITLPYLELIVQTKLGEVPIKDGNVLRCYGLLQEKLAYPCLLELIWSYWHEEGMLVQTMNAISMRFQNKRGLAAGNRDPLTRFDLDPLRSLNNLLWGYIQDEQHRLNLPRRVYEYDHHYGLTLYGKAVPRLRPVDSRSKFLEAFHNLLYLCSVFFKEDDDTTMVADGFPMLNALKEVHMLLAQGAHNQYGDLPWTARQEMMMQQWLLARPEMREFLRGRIMVPYPEGWMDCVDTMKMLQGWTDVTITHFNYLATFGERVLLSIRYGNWIEVDNREQAANWARYWRPEIQGYIHNYRAVTGVDLSSELTSGHVDYTMPSVHLRRRLAAQVQR